MQPHRKTKAQIRAMTHLRVNEHGLVELWGGPVWTVAANFVAEDGDARAMPPGTVIIQTHYYRAGDDGPCWRREVSFTGTEVVKVRRFEDTAQVLLPHGSVLMLEMGGFELSLDAQDYEILEGELFRLLNPVKPAELLPGVDVFSIYKDSREG